ncbi:cytochrome oxidase assembly protein [Bordetella ansorpii]|uniref:Cytochrome oxidase assembly protein n=1 Tax=Bordetella ansorpii TaxID=288768 RepID=A0A157S7D9_9BORD|nr:COX15/CtaA family protein [Bordetella ansorpii]SAI66324.1 cytochrome oxidase assembly protein [Bordetella ansorpii]
MEHDRIKLRYRKLVFFTWFLTLDLIMFGAFVRLTDSGLGCPDWPGCYASVTPIGAMHHIDAASQAMPFGPVTLSKAWIEMIHRYVGATLGLLIIAIVVMAWRHRARLGRSPLLATVTLVAVCVQGAFGAWTVTHKLMPAVVTSHLVLGLLLLSLMTWLAAREQPHLALSAAAARWRPWMRGGLLLLLIQVTLGGWVSTNYAALACMDFPTCHGAWVPEMDFQGGFSIIRGLGELPSGEMISQSALTAIHWVHRNFAFVVFAYLGVLGFRLRTEPGIRTPATLLLGLLLAQLLTGLTTIFFQWPLLIAVLHNGGAAGLTLASVVILVRLASAGQRPVQPA